PTLLRLQYPSVDGVLTRMPVAFMPLAVGWTLRQGWRLAVGHAKLEPITRARPLEDGEIPVIAVTRNEIGLLKSFLAHYRQLDVRRFLIVDDQSTDGTTAFLAAQPDVDLYRSNVRYGAAFAGRLWRQMLIDRYGRDRWYVMVDADEFLVTSPRLSVHQIAQRLSMRR